MKEIKNLKEFATKKYGQNFLKDETILEKIVEAIPKRCLNIVEIGSGLGDLTKKLINIADVTAFEVDARLCKILGSTFKREIESGQLKLECGDVLEYWRQNGSLSSNNYCLIANLPYYIATNIILRAFRDSRCHAILVMVQKEVAQKFCAKSGDREFSAFSVLAWSIGEARVLFDVSPQSFVPAPKVTSSVMLITKSKSIQNSGFEEFLKVAFKQPRKKLFKNLSLKYAKKHLLTLFESLHIDPNIRPHQTEISVYQQLYKKLSEDKTDGREQQKKSRRALIKIKGEGKKE
jgi:16S rRNA (adenine1518-N6/adenine1519-N6)-dimethyltransferase